jgi:hypothetical protein
MSLSRHRFTWGLIVLLALALSSGIAFARGGHRGGQGGGHGAYRTGGGHGAYRTGGHGAYRGGGHGGGVYVGYHGGAPGHRAAVHHGGHGPGPRFSGGRAWWPRYWRGAWVWTAYAPSYAYAAGSYGYFWYYCPQLDAFYPDLLSCPAPWQLVPAS